ncbi:efflux RND transporter periplasmic adaptor subunit [Variovorax sp. dw_308]|uniref:efflux RND transporter periplasmic adaptor subunit n=1 Tax=Variovorax sp. dw_308 TaxID=2721546 RepID=UPI001C457B14|nr:HlyD family efflux transporter periplasmic adaptor subunit [Variovorax sp. dw_308]
MTHSLSQVQVGSFKRAAHLSLLGLALAAPFAMAQTAPGADAGVARGVLRAQQEAVLSSSVSERITSMPFREGDRFPKGAVLVGFDCARLGAELNAARAGQKAEARNAEVQSALLGMEATGRAEAEIAGLKEKERAAQSQVIQERMTGCRVVAPFAGRVVETMTRVHESPQANEKLMRVVSDGPVELHMVVPSKWLAWLHTGSDFNFKVDETGDVLQAKVQRISGGVDAVSQTIKVIAAVPKIPAQVLPGMSGRATLGAAAPVAATAAAVPVAAAVPNAQVAAAPVAPVASTSTKVTAVAQTTSAVRAR